MTRPISFLTWGERGGSYSHGWRLVMWSGQYFPIKKKSKERRGRLFSAPDWLRREFNHRAARHSCIRCHLSHWSRWLNWQWRYQNVTDRILSNQICVFSSSPPLSKDFLWALSQIDMWNRSILSGKRSPWFFRLILYLTLKRPHFENRDTVLIIWLQRD